jgi:hypothetical protein
MPVMSYLAYPVDGRYEEMSSELSQIANCQFIPAENREIGIFVSDTESETEEGQLQQRLKEITSIKCLAMTYAHTDNCS